MLDIDGIIGPATIGALQGFLKALGLYAGPIDGVIDQPESDTVRALQTLLNKGVSSVTVTAINLD